MSNSNQVRIISMREAGYDTPPGPGPVLQRMRFTDELLSYTPNTEVSAELNNSRLVPDQNQVGSATGGPVAFEFSAVTFDEWLEGLFFNAWNIGGGSTLADILTVGTDDTQNQFLLHKDYLDVGTAFLMLTGQRVNTLEMVFQFGQFITGTFGFAGASADVVTGLTAPSITDPTVTPVFTASSDVSNVIVSGVSTGICVNQIRLNVTNGLRASDCLGSITPTDQKPGRMVVSGNIQMLLSNTAWAIYQNTLAQTPIDTSWRVSDALGNIYWFNFPQIKLSGPTPSAAGIDQDVIVDAAFNAVGKTTAQYFQIERTLV